MIYVTVGTHHCDFARLIRAVDAFARNSDEEIIVQTGLCTSLPAHCAHFDFKPREECLDLQRNARVIVCHAGIGAILDALRVQRPFVVVPRLKRFREHNSDHQIQLAEAVESRRWAAVIRDTAYLPPALVNPLPPPAGYAPAKTPLLNSIEQFVHSTCLSCLEGG